MNRIYPLQSLAETPPQDESLTLLGMWKMMSRRRWLVTGVAATLLAAAAVYCVMVTRQYRATAEIQIQADSPAALGLGALGAGDGGGMSDVLDASRALQTQAKILESETLALEVVKQLKLEQHADFQPSFDPMGKLMALVTPKGVPDRAGAALDDAPARREEIFKRFQKNTLVKPVGGTRLIDVSYTSSDPQVAAATVNKLVDDLVDYNFQTRFKASSQASEWIGKQLSDLRGNSEKLQAQVADMQGESGVYSFGGEAAGSKGPGYSTVLDQLQQATTNLTQAESNRVLRGAMYEAAKSGDPDTIAGINSSMMAGGQPSAISNSLSLIGTLRDQEATAKAQLSEMSAKFGPEYPKLEELRANVSSLGQSIRTEQGRLLDQTHSDFVVAQDVEAHMRQAFDEQKHQAQSLNSKAVEYGIVHQEADESRGLYERLLTRLKEAGVLEGMRPSNISVVEPGRVPAKPARPNVPLYLGAALGGGVLLGVLAAMLLEVMDSKVRSASLDDFYGHGLVAELPFERRSKPRSANLLLPGQAPIFTLAHPASPFSEALRGLRTSILLPMEQGEHRVILITSSVFAEGKTTLATNLATSLAQMGKRVLLIDADLRNPRLHTLFDIQNNHGLGDVLSGDGHDGEAIHSMQAIADVPGLTVLPAGTSSAHPTVLLGSERMRRFIGVCKEHFDFVILDGEPILPVTDSIVLSPMSDQVLLLARHGVTERSMLEKSLRIVMSSNPRASLGVVINAIKARPADESQRYHNSYARVPVLGGM
jgi:succinoglycan biosynthesis transport protein ExoP